MTRRSATPAPLIASVRPQPHPGDLVTATRPSKIDTGDLSGPAAPAPYERYRNRAETILNRVANACEAVVISIADPLDIPDHVTRAMTDAGRALVELAALEAARDRQHGRLDEPDLIIDVLGESWFAEHDDEGNYAAEDDPAKVFTASYIRSSWGPTREYVLRPPRPGS